MTYRTTPTFRPREMASIDDMTFRRAERRVRGRTRTASLRSIPRKFFTGTLLIVLLLSFRAIAVTAGYQSSHFLPQFRLHEAWSLIVSLKLDDYINIAVGSFAALPFFTCLAVLVGLSILRYSDSPAIWADVLWQRDSLANWLRVPMVICGIVMVMAGGVVGIVVLAVVLAIMLLKDWFGSNLPRTLNRNLRLATSEYRKWSRADAYQKLLDKVQLNYSIPYADATTKRILQQLVARSRVNYDSWVKLKRILRELRYTDYIDPWGDRRGEGIAKAVDEAIKAKYRYLTVLHRLDLEVEKRAKRSRRGRIFVALLQVRWLFNRFAIPTAPTALAVIGIGASAVVLLSSKPWVPNECFLMSSGEQIDGFRLSDTGSIITILEYSSRDVLAESTTQITQISSGLCRTLIPQSTGSGNPTIVTNDSGPTRP